MKQRQNQPKNSLLQKSLCLLCISSCSLPTTDSFAIGRPNTNLAPPISLISISSACRRSYYTKSTDAILVSTTTTTTGITGIVSKPSPLLFSRCCTDYIDMNIGIHQYHHQHQHNQHNQHNHDHNQRDSNIRLFSLPPSLPESSSSRNERNNKGKPKPLLRKSKIKTALKATGATTKAIKRTTTVISKKSNTRPSSSKSSSTSSSSSSQIMAAKKKNKSYEYTGFSNRARAKRLDGRSTTAGAWYLRDEMMRHDILTREDEARLGTRIVRAKTLRDEMSALIERRTLNEFNNEIDVDEDVDVDENKDWDDFGGFVTGDYHDNDWKDDQSLQIESELGDWDEDQSQIGMYGNPYIGETTIHNEQHIQNFKGDSRISSTLVRDGSKLTPSSFDADLNLLSNDDVILELSVKGGKDELRGILKSGAKARNILMRSNIRLVVSVGKKWMGRSKDHNGIADRYKGSWNRPSLDEVIQEGMLGLARAVDKYDPDRGLRFSTYSTHWITSYVRQCFQVAATGCLKIPSQLHDIKHSYTSILKRQIEASEAIPTDQEIADEIGVTLARLRTSIRVTESLVSIDEPVYSGGTSGFKGSGAGGDYAGDNSLLLSDRLECSELPPEDYVENGFLRQTLENAMAAELSPYERDILRLRLGLDDGQPRSIREVVEACGGDISVTDVRSAERRAFKKLRSPNAVQAHNLVAYFEMADISFDADEMPW